MSQEIFPVVHYSSSLLSTSSGLIFHSAYTEFAMNRAFFNIQILLRPFIFSSSSFRHYVFCVSSLSSLVGHYLGWLFWGGGEELGCSSWCVCVCVCKTVLAPNCVALSISCVPCVSNGGQLIELLKSEDKSVVSIACYDLGEFVRFYPSGKTIARHLG